MLKNDVDQSRRTVITWLAALAGSSLLSSCCSFARSCGISIPHPEPETLPASDSKFKFAIFDCHTHIFNAKDLQVKGYLEGPVALDYDENKNPVLARVIRKLAGPIQVFGHSFAPGAADEVKKLSMPSVSLRQVNSTAVSEEENATRNLLVNLLNQINFNKELKIAAAQENELQSFGHVSDFPYDRAAVDNILDAHLPGNEDKLIQLKDRKEIGFIVFLRNALSYRFQNVQHLWEAYGSNQDIRPDAYFISLVDFDYLLEEPGRHCSTPVCIKDQILLSEALVKRFGGAVIPLVPYNPWKDRKEAGQSFRDVVDAIENHGFVGVKIYPTLGFAPFGNTDIGANNPPAIWKKIEPVTDPKVIGVELDQHLLRLLTWCAQNEVPIMAHNGCSMGTGIDEIDLAAPQYWGKALKASYEATNKPLRVNLGHFGGEKNCHCDHLDAEFCWQSDFIQLMNNPEGRWLYADIAYWKSFLLREDDPINKFLAKQLASGKVLRSHLMYGSDWFMISQEKNYWNYAENIHNWADKVDSSKDLTQRLFHSNIADLFGLRAKDQDGNTPASRSRLEKYYAKNNIPTPLWMGKLL